MYAELKCKTHYSFLEGASSPEALIQQAALLQLRAIAITDRNGVYGIPKAYLAIRELQKATQDSNSKTPPLKLITGSEITLDGGATPPLTLIAQTRRGYGWMCRILTEAHKNAPKGQANLPLIQLLESGSHPGSQECFAIPGMPEPGQEIDWARLDRLVEFFGKRLLIPISRFQDGLDQERCKTALALTQRYSHPLIAHNDVVMAQAKNRILQDVLTATRHLKTLRECGTLLSANAERRLKSGIEMRALFCQLEEPLRRAVDQTLEVADQCTFCPSELKYRYPSEWIPADHTAQSYLEELTWKGAESRYPAGIPQAVRAQIEHEFKLISQLGFADYFLTIWDIVFFARSKKILCQGRGSAANSAVCYCLGITAVDPVRMQLLFERFISAERGEPPDIDVDFEHERREEVIQYIYARYGRDRAAMVSAVITYRTRSAIRDVSRALGTPTGQESASATSLHHQLTEELVTQLKGTPRHLSIHSGGFTLSADPMIETVPIEPARMDGRTIIQWDKYDLDAIGLLKIDVLALGMLSAIQKTLTLIGRELHEIPAEDPATYQMIQRAETVGVFQIESRAQMNMLGRLQPENFYDLVIEVALVRPGPIVGKMVHPYLKRRRGTEPVDVPHPKLEPILRRTLGVPIFQEQVMQMAIALADFTPGEADRLRRAIGAWRSSGSIEEMGNRLKMGLLRNGLPQEFVDRVFEQIKGFSEYGFPESHAASFALLAYASSYLKCHHPTEFFASLINSQPMGFYSNYTLIEEAKRSAVQVLPVDLLQSQWHCTTLPQTIQLGFSVVRHLERREFERIQRERKSEAFSSFTDFVSRTALKKSSLHSLAISDTFRIFGFDQRQALWELLRQELSVLKRNLGDQPVQLDLFSSLPDSDSQRFDFDAFTTLEAIRADYQATGMSTRGHPMAALRELARTQPELKRTLSAQHSGEIRKLPHKSRIRVTGLLIVRQKPYTANGTTFATLEDEHGFLDLVLWKDTYARYKSLFDEESVLTITGELQRDRNSISIVVSQVESLSFKNESSSAVAENKKSPESEKFHSRAWY
jgi:error-prone DNA polymerase